MKRNKYRFKRLTTLLPFQDDTHCAQYCGYVELVLSLSLSEACLLCNSGINLSERKKSCFKRLTTLLPFQDLTHQKVVVDSDAVI